jgi:hypothetical protein
VVAGVSTEEVLNCLKNRSPVSTGLVQHVTNRRNEKICTLILTNEWLEKLKQQGPKAKGLLRITWAIGENLMFILEFPRKALRPYEVDGRRGAKVRVATTRLVIYHGSATRLLPLSACPGEIDFGEDLRVIPFSLYQAADSYVKSNPQLWAKPRPSVA